jgi:hypothetical protein
VASAGGQLAQNCTLSGSIIDCRDCPKRRPLRSTAILPGCRTRPLLHSVAANLGFIDIVALSLAHPHLRRRHRSLMSRASQTGRYYRLWPSRNQVHVGVRAMLPGCSTPANRTSDIKSMGFFHACAFRLTLNRSRALTWTACRSRIRAPGCNRCSGHNAANLRMACTAVP